MEFTNVPGLERRRLQIPRLLEGFENYITTFSKTLLQPGAVGSESLHSSQGLVSVSGGEVTFDIGNDAPTLTGAKATFNISIHPPGNQTVLPDGIVVWSHNCTINGSDRNQNHDQIYD